MSELVLEAIQITQFPQILEQNDGKTVSQFQLGTLVRYKSLHLLRLPDQFA